MARDYINEKYMDTPGITYHEVSIHFKKDFGKEVKMFNPVAKALASPGEKVLHEFEDTGNPRGRWYAGYMLYDPVADTIQTWGNMAFYCPVRSNHHIGSTCPCCKLHG